MKLPDELTQKRWTERGGVHSPASERPRGGYPVPQGASA